MGVGIAKMVVGIGKMVVGIGKMVVGIAKMSVGMGQGAVGMGEKPREQEKRWVGTETGPVKAELVGTLFPGNIDNRSMYDYQVI